MSLKGLGVFGVLGQGLPSSGFDTSNLEPFICRVRIVRPIVNRRSQGRPGPEILDFGS